MVIASFFFVDVVVIEACEILLQEWVDSISVRVCLGKREEPAKKFLI